MDYGLMALDMLMMSIEAERRRAYERGRWLRELRELRRRDADAPTARRSEQPPEKIRARLAECTSELSDIARFGDVAEQM